MRDQPFAVVLRQTPLIERIDVVRVDERAAEEDDVVVQRYDGQENQRRCGQALAGLSAVARSAKVDHDAFCAKQSSASWRPARWTRRASRVPPARTMTSVALARQPPGSCV